MTLKFNSNGYGNRQMKETAFVTTNDPERRRFDLSLTGYVEKFALVWPDAVSLTGKPGEVARETVRIVPRPEYPFKIIETKALRAGQIGFELEPQTDGSYLLHVWNLAREAGRYSDTVNLTTDSPIKSRIVVRVKILLEPNPAE